MESKKKQRIPKKKLWIKKIKRWIPKKRDKRFQKNKVDSKKQLKGLQLDSWKINKIGVSIKLVKK